ncbi:ETC complex I subunit [Bradyrhizobium sp. WSM 1738]|uniref:NADH dehydrogenase ubiquinone Fe-S protein 4 n=1 Tax=Bradyrhizobium hereditatis TaxID=2821405 RepID=UPI001CE2F241|nr:NADH dehydrogenase ubiquinone Fe-S protein 4 [Bradyrhizobium hereditatis]MCA6117074.1 ETC complex I subunit [Bradyrhizobium hereditatis]
METVTINGLKKTRREAAFAANDDHMPDGRLTPSLFPRDAVARIFRPQRSAMTSGNSRSKGWRLVFERRSAPYVEPLMGWTGDDDPLATVGLSFPTLKAAIRYAERQQIPYVVEGGPEQNAKELQAMPHKMTRAFSDATLARLGLGSLQESYDKAVAGAEARHDRRGEEGWTSPMAVVRDASLSLDAKRSILIDWAWTEYLIDQATNEGMPENGRPSRLHEVELALLALERANAPVERVAPASERAA